MRCLILAALLAGCVAESDGPDTFGSSSSSTGESESGGDGDEGVGLEDALAMCDAEMEAESAACEDGYYALCVVEMHDDPCCEGEPDFAAMCEPYPCHTDPEHETPYCRLSAPSGCGENLCSDCMRACDSDPDCDLEESAWECVAEIPDYP